MTASPETARDDRKSAALAADRITIRDGAREVGSYETVREVLRSAAMEQAGMGDTVGSDVTAPEFASVFFLDGPEHKRKRANIAPYFTPKAIQARHRLVMESATERLIAQLRSNGRGELDKIAFELAVEVAAAVVGLTESDYPGMARRIDRSMVGAPLQEMSRFKKPFGMALAAVHALRFFTADVRPAVKARRAARRDDIISHLLDEGYPDKAILIECLTYAGAGMVTTREFITMCAWHFFDDSELRERFLAGDEKEQVTILEELLRLEPIAGLLFRKASGYAALPSSDFAEDEEVVLNIRAANVDEASVGTCPFQVDPDRAARMKITGAYLSFGDGSHRCPGANVALGETRIFLDRLLRVPGIRLDGEPEMTWNSALASYELRRAFIVCDPA
jgi:cytochrome P450